MNLQEFEKEYNNLKDHKTNTVDKFGKKLIKEGISVSFFTK